MAPMDMENRVGIPLSVIANGLIIGIEMRITANAERVEAALQR
jgi:hypothetical protein